MFTYPKVLGGLAVVGIIVGIYTYVTGLQQDIVDLTEKNTELTQSNEALLAERNRTEASLRTTKANLSIVNTKFKQAQEDKKAIIRLFGDHDFEKLLRAKPEWMSKKMTEGTRRVFRDIEDASK